MDGLLISGLLVNPCISAGTLAISVGSKVILSGCYNGLFGGKILV
jgi:hypothetical protein